MLLECLAVLVEGSILVIVVVTLLVTQLGALLELDDTASGKVHWVAALEAAFFFAPRAV